MRLSIIIPVYNVERYLNECLEDLIFQIRNDIEIILVDDGSTDCSGKICDEYSDKYSFITTIHKKNGGLSSARNEGIRIAKGEYLIFIDSDDRVSKKLFECVLECIDKEHPDIIEYDFDKFIDGKPMRFDDCDINMDVDIETIAGNENIYDAYFITRSIKRETWTKAYRSSLFKEIFFPVGRLAEDLATTYKILSKPSKITIVNRTLYYYRVRNNSIMGSGSIKLFYDAMLAHYEIYDFIKLNKKYVKIAYTNYFNNLMKLYAKNFYEKLEYKNDEILKRYNDIEIKKINFTGKFVLVISKINMNILLKLLYFRFIKTSRKV